MFLGVVFLGVVVLGVGLAVSEDMGRTGEGEDEQDKGTNDDGANTHRATHAQRALSPEF